MNLARCAFLVLALLMAPTLLAYTQLFVPEVRPKGVDQGVIDAPDEHAGARASVAMDLVAVEAPGRIDEESPASTGADGRSNPVAVTESVNHLDTADATPKDARDEGSAATPERSQQEVAGSAPAGDENENADAVDDAGEETSAQATTETAADEGGQGGAPVGLVDVETIGAIAPFDSSEYAQSDSQEASNAPPSGYAEPDPSLIGPPLPDPDANEFGAVAIELLNARVPIGTRERLLWTTGQSFSGSVMETPVVVVHGVRRGPRLCLTAGVHGDELNGVEVVRRLAYKINPEELAGTVIAVPIVNLLGFSRGSRYLPDRRDLNRFFPGSPGGSSASRIAHSFFSQIIVHCDALVDFHTGSFDRANLPQVRADLTDPAVLEFTRGFGATAVLHSPGASGMLRIATSKQGIPAVTFEIGGPLQLEPDEIKHGVQAIETLMYKMGMSELRRRWNEPQAVFYESRWIRANHGGMLFSEVKLGDRVRSGQSLGRVIDPVSNHSSEIKAPEAGRIIGMAVNQLVLPGFAAYNLGIASSEEQVVTEATMSDPDDERFMESEQLSEDGSASMEGEGREAREESPTEFRDEY